MAQPAPDLFPPPPVLFLDDADAKPPPLDGTPDRPLCECCHKLAFKPEMAKVCLHTVCLACRSRHQRSCGVCGQRTTYVPNYTVHNAVHRNPALANEVAALENAYQLETPQGKINALVAQMPDFEVYEVKYDVPEQWLVLNWLHGIVERKQPHDAYVNEWMAYGIEPIVLVFDTEQSFTYVMPQRYHTLMVRMGRWTAVFATRTKKFAHRVPPVQRQ